MKSIYIALIAFLLTSIIISGCLTTPVGQGTLIVAVKDAPKTTDIGKISALWLNISEVSVHKAAANLTTIETETITITESNDTSTAGWVVVVNQTQTFNLIEFTNNVSQILGQQTIDAGKYTEIRLKIDSGNITVDGNVSPLTIPSGMLKMNRGFVLEANSTLKLILDFNVEKSVIITGTNEYKLVPVIAVLEE